MTSALAAIGPALPLMNADSDIIVLHIYHATIASQNACSAKFSATGSHVQRQHTPPGYLSDGFLLREFPTIPQREQMMSHCRRDWPPLLLPLLDRDHGSDVRISRRSNDYFILTIRNWALNEMADPLWVNNRTAVICGPATLEGQGLGCGVHLMRDVLCDGKTTEWSAADFTVNETASNPNWDDSRFPRAIDPPCRTGPPNPQKWCTHLLAA